MKVLSTEGLTKLIQLIKSNFISKDDTVTTNTVTLADVATTGDYDDLINKPTEVTESTVSGWGFTKNAGTVTSVNNTQPDSNGNVTITIPDTATWGNITGTLSNQTDLQSALNDKYDASNPDGFISGITSSDVTTALGFTPYSASNPNNYTSNVGTVTSVNNVEPDANGNVTLVIPDTASWGNITGTLSNQTDLQTELNKKLENIATGTNALTIKGVAATVSGGTNIGTSSTAGGAGATAIGWAAGAGASASALGMMAKANGNYSIQLGYGTNSTASTLSVGFNASTASARTNWTLLDGLTGLIPDERMSSNIARTSAINEITTDLNGKVDKSSIWYDSSTSTLNIGISQ